MNKVGSQIAVVLLPVLVLCIAYWSWMMWRVGHAPREYVFMSSLIGIPLLSVLISVGLPYYRAHPLVGFVTAICLLALFPVGNASTAADGWQLGFALVTVFVGGGFTLLFLCLSLVTVREAAGP